MGDGVRGEGVMFFSHTVMYDDVVREGACFEPAAGRLCYGGREVVGAERRRRSGNAKNYTATPQARKFFALEVCLQE